MIRKFDRSHKSFMEEMDSFIGFTEMSGMPDDCARDYISYVDINLNIMIDFLTRFDEKKFI